MLDNGSRPVQDFLDRLAKDKGDAFYGRMFALVQSAPPFPTLATFKPLRNFSGLWELLTPNYRIIGFRYGRSLAVLVEGFKKTAKETPKEAVRLVDKIRDQFVADQAKKGRNAQ